AATAAATAGESYGLRSARGLVQTITRMHVDEAIAGSLRSGDEFDVVELGGLAGDIGWAIAGSPRFTPGERTLLMLIADDDGQWTTQSMALGRFTFTGDLLLRDEREIVGWDTDGTPH